jgi:hypothetical protein
MALKKGDPVKVVINQKELPPPPNGYFGRLAAPIQNKFFLETK